MVTALFEEILKKKNNRPDEPDRVGPDWSITAEPLKKAAFFYLFRGLFSSIHCRKNEKKKGRGAPAKQRVKLPMNSKMCLALQ